MINQRLVSPLSLLTLAGLLALVFAVGWLGSYVTIPKIGGWYAEIAKSPLNPPRWVFAPAWTILYILMAVAAWLVARSDAAGKRDALTVWFLQLALNCAWSILFFGMQRPDLALIDILFLNLAILGCMISFRAISRTAFWLLVPYIAWTLYATFLNFEVWRLN
jgi:tryptophan-rich sensory protein